MELEERTIEQLPDRCQNCGEGGDDDRVAQLERLAKLRDSGALSEQEFEREKARILGE